MPIPNSKEEIVAKAFELGYVKTAKIRVEEREKQEVEMYKMNTPV